jgi:hypothetical protein
MMEFVSWGCEIPNIPNMMGISMGIQWDLASGQIDLAMEFLPFLIGKSSN